MKSKSTRADILTSLKQVRANENMKAQENEVQNMNKPKKQLQQSEKRSVSECAPGYVPLKDTIRHTNTIGGHDVWGKPKHKL